MRRAHISALLVLALPLLATAATQAEESAPPFSLPQWGTSTRLGLRDLRGGVLVLDFFSASCGVCFRASRDLQLGIQDFYAARDGNAHGVRVRVVAVSTEAVRPGEMEAFLKETGMDLVLDDADGAVLQRYGGSTVPYLVVIDATGRERDAVPPRVLYRQAGFAELGTLRQVIDGIAGQAEPPGSSPVGSADVGPVLSTSWPQSVAATAAMGPVLAATRTEQRVLHEAAADSVALIASDVLVAETLAEYRQTRLSSELTLSLSHRYIEVHHESDYLGVRGEDDLTSNRSGIRTRGRFGMSGPLTLTVEGGAYEGYQNYRSLWLNEYYRHMVDVLKTYFDDLKGYREAEPWGCNASTGLRWEYLPAAGSVEASLSYQYDVVAPGYEIGTRLVRLRDQYDTVSGRLAFENVLTRRVRALAECQIDDATDRELRFTLQESLNCALAEHWVLRLALAGATEEPDFESKSVGATLERDWYGTWFVSLFGRYYEDTSEIENAVSGSAVAPPLETYQTGVGLRWQGQRSSLKLVVGPCFSRYHADSPRVTAFDQLYQDRDWLSVQLAFVREY